MDKPSIELQSAARALKSDFVQLLARVPASDEENFAEQAVVAALRRLVIFAPVSPCDHDTLLRHQREEIGKLHAQLNVFADKVEENLPACGLGIHGGRMRPGICRQSHVTLLHIPGSD